MIPFCRSDARQVIVKALDGCIRNSGWQFAQECAEVFNDLQRNKESELVLLARKGA